MNSSSFNPLSEPPSGEVREEPLGNLSPGGVLAEGYRKQPSAFHHQTTAKLYSQVNININWPWKLFHRKSENICCLHLNKLFRFLWEIKIYSCLQFTLCRRMNKLSLIVLIQWGCLMYFGSKKINAEKNYFKFWTQVEYQEAPIICISWVIAYPVYSNDEAAKSAGIVEVFPI